MYFILGLFGTLKVFGCGFHFCFLMLGGELSLNLLQVFESTAKLIKIVVVCFRVMTKAYKLIRH